MLTGWLIPHGRADHAAVHEVLRQHFTVRRRIQLRPASLLNIERNLRHQTINLVLIQRIVVLAAAGKQNLQRPLARVLRVQLDSVRVLRVHTECANLRVGAGLRRKEQTPSLERIRVVQHVIAATHQQYDDQQNARRQQEPGCVTDIDRFPILVDAPARQRNQEDRGEQERNTTEDPVGGAVVTDRLYTRHRAAHTERCAQLTQRRRVDARHAQHTVVLAVSANCTPLTAANTRTQVHHEERQNQRR